MKRDPGNVVWDLTISSYRAIKSCQIDCIYESNAHEHHHKELGACQWENASDAMDAAKDNRYAASRLDYDWTIVMRC